MTYTRFFDREAVSLARAGFRVSLVGLEAVRPSDVPNGVELVGVTRRHGFSKRRTLAEIRAAAWSADADAYHCFDPWTLEIGLELKRRRPTTKLVYDSTELFPEVYAQRSDLTWPVRRWLAARVRRLEAEAIVRADCIIETNATRAARFQARDSRVVLVPNYPPLTAVRPMTGARRPWLCWTGMMSRHRGFDRLLRAFGRVAGQFPESRLKVMGEFDSRERLEPECRDLVAGHGLTGRVDLLGWQPYDRMFEILAGGLAGVILLQPGRRNDYTGQPNKLFDFMAAGLAVVASDFPEIGSVVRDSGCGTCVDPTKEDEIANVLAALLADAPGTVQMGLAGRKAVADRYNWSVAETALVGVYREFWP